MHLHGRAGHILFHHILILIADVKQKDHAKIKYHNTTIHYHLEVLQHFLQ